MKVERRLDRLEKAIKHVSEGLWKVSDEIAILRKGKHNPARVKVETRILELENKFFAFQCGAQTQMERDQKTIDRATQAARRAQRAKGGRA